MKILIVEDDPRFIADLIDVAKDLGEVSVCTTGEGRTFPDLREVLGKAKWADVILLDHDLQTNYAGTDIAKFCYDKKIVGISTTISLGQYWYDGKSFLLKPGER